MTRPRPPLCQTLNHATFDLSVTRCRPLLGQVLIRTLNHTSCRFVTNKSDRNNKVCVDEVMWCAHKSSRTPLQCTLCFISEHMWICIRLKGQWTFPGIFSFEINKILQLQIMLNPRYANNVIWNADVFRWPDSSSRQPGLKYSTAHKYAQEVLHCKNTQAVKRS